MYKYLFLSAIALSQTAFAADQYAATYLDGTDWTTPSTYGLAQDANYSQIQTNGQYSWITGTLNGKTAAVYFDGSNPTPPFTIAGLADPRTAFFAAYPGAEHLANPSTANQGWFLGFDARGNGVVDYYQGSTLQSSIDLNYLKPYIADSSEGHFWVLSDSSDSTGSIKLSLFSPSTQQQPTPITVNNGDLTSGFDTAIASTFFFTYRNGSTQTFERADANGTITKIADVTIPSFAVSDLSNWQCSVTPEYINKNPNQATAEGGCNYFSSTYQGPVAFVVAFISKTTDGGKTWSTEPNSAKTWSATQSPSGFMYPNLSLRNGRYLNIWANQAYAYDTNSSTPAWVEINPNLLADVVSQDGTIYDTYDKQACTLGSDDKLSCKPIAGLPSGCLYADFFGSTADNRIVATCQNGQNPTGIATYDPTSNSWSFQAAKVGQDSMFSSTASLGYELSDANVDGKTWLNVLNV